MKAKKQDKLIINDKLINKLLEVNGTSDDRHQRIRDQIENNTKSEVKKKLYNPITILK